MSITKDHQYLAEHAFKTADMALADFLLENKLITEAEYSFKYDGTRFHVVSEAVRDPRYVYNNIEFERIVKILNSVDFNSPEEFYNLIAGSNAPEGRTGLYLKRMFDRFYEGTSQVEPLPNSELTKFQGVRDIGTLRQFIKRRQREEEGRDVSDIDLDAPRFQNNADNINPRGSRTGSNTRNAVRASELYPGDIYNDMSRIPPRQWNSWWKLHKQKTSVADPKTTLLSWRKWSKHFIMGYEIGNGQVFEIWYNGKNGNFSVHDRYGNVVPRGEDIPLVRDAMELLFRQVAQFSQDDAEFIRNFSPSLAAVNQDLARDVDQVAGNAQAFARQREVENEDIFVTPEIQDQDRQANTNRFDGGNSSAIPRGAPAFSYDPYDHGSDAKPRGATPLNSKQRKDDRDEARRVRQEEIKARKAKDQKTTEIVKSIEVGEDDIERNEDRRTRLLNAPVGTKAALGYDASANTEKPKEEPKKTDDVINMPYRPEVINLSYDKKADKKKPVGKAKKASVSKMTPTIAPEFMDKLDATKQVAAEKEKKSSADSLKNNNAVQKKSRPNPTTPPKTEVVKTQTKEKTGFDVKQMASTDELKVILKRNDELEAAKSIQEITRKDLVAMIVADYGSINNAKEEDPEIYAEYVAAKSKIDAITAELADIDAELEKYGTSRSKLKMVVNRKEAEDLKRQMNENFFSGGKSVDPATNASRPDTFDDESPIYQRSSQDLVNQNRSQAANSAFTKQVVSGSFMSGQIVPYYETRSREYRSVLQRTMDWFTSTRGRPDPIVIPANITANRDRIAGFFSGAESRADFIIGFSVANVINVEVWYVQEVMFNAQIKTSYYVYDVTAEKVIQGGIPHYRNAMQVIARKLATNEYSI